MPVITLAGYDASWLLWSLVWIAAAVGIIAVAGFALYKLSVVSFKVADWLSFWPIIFGVVVGFVLAVVAFSQSLQHDVDEKMRAIVAEGFTYPDIYNKQYTAVNKDGNAVIIEFMHLYEDQWTYRVVSTDSD